MPVSHVCIFISIIECQASERNEVFHTACILFVYFNAFWIVTIGTICVFSVLMFNSIFLTPSYILVLVVRI